MIWEYTWPAPRVIEVALFDNPEYKDEEPEEEIEEETDEETDQLVEVINLRLGGSLSGMLKTEMETRVTESRPLEPCPPPFALHICHQSRIHTLRRYRIMESLAGPFYYYPQRDVIFFSIDVDDDYPVHMPILEKYHKTELNTVETILVSEYFWPESPRPKGYEPQGMDYTLNWISHLGALQTTKYATNK